jgi:hypothetical protein
MTPLDVRYDPAHFDAVGCHRSSGSRFDLGNEGLSRGFGVEDVDGGACVGRQSNPGGRHEPWHRRDSLYNLAQLRLRGGLVFH